MKEELRSQFEKFIDDNDASNEMLCDVQDDLFQWFWQEIEQREKAHKIELSNYAYQADLAKRERDQAEAKISHLEALVVAADEVIEKAKHSGYFNNPHNSFWVYLAKFNELKSNLK